MHNGVAARSSPCGQTPNTHLQRHAWHLYYAGCPKRNPDSTQGRSMLQCASIRNPPCGTCSIAASVRNLNCAGP
eukprot:4061524-Alexandrium_andersonii.AAC.1